MRGGTTAPDEEDFEWTTDSGASSESSAYSLRSGDVPIKKEKKKKMKKRPKKVDASKMNVKKEPQEAAGEGDDNFVVQDQSGQVVATEGVKLVKNEAGGKANGGLTFELSAVDKAGNPIKFQVSGMDSTALSKLTGSGRVRVSGAGVEKFDPMVKNEFQCTECYKVSILTIFVSACSYIFVPELPFM
jgi:hypothetical protein